uniref:Chromo domain-containing protein n=1 Tax=Rhinopithecus bieti TaxID=61621 RepID=A0A2K6LKN4_RHIBE
MASQEFEVETIVDKRQDNNGNTVDLVRWKGYDKQDDTWEPEQHLMNCENLFAAIKNVRRKAASLLTDAKDMELINSTLKTFAPDSPIDNKKTVSGFQELKKLDPIAVDQQDVVGFKVTEGKPVRDTLSGPSAEQAGMENRTLLQPLISQMSGSVTASMATGSAPQKAIMVLIDSLAATGTTDTCTSVPRVKDGKRHVTDDGRDQLTESASTYRDIVVKKEDGFTQILLSTRSTEKNALNTEIIKEMVNALNRAAAEDSKLVLFSAAGSVFSCGLDLEYFVKHLRNDRNRASFEMVNNMRNFVNTFIQFKKPIVVSVNGPAIGLGASILPLCDLVWATKKNPDACSTVTFPKIMGEASANEMLIAGRKLTAREVCAKGLVSQVFLTGTFTEEVMIQIRELSLYNAVVLEECKALVHCNIKMELEKANKRECEVLRMIWGSAQGVESMVKYVENKITEF